MSIKYIINNLLYKQLFENRCYLKLYDMLVYNVGNFALLVVM